MGLFLLTLFAQVVLAAVGVHSCSDEADCLNGYSCTDGICKKCLKCDLLLRKGKPCVVDFNECGGCLEGFEEISITDFSTAIKPCKPVKKKFKFKECTNSSSCPPNNYCSEESCVKCFDCSLVNRLSPPGKCAKELNDCGSCMNGFLDVAITTDTNSKLCEMKDLDTLVVTSFKNLSFWAVLPLFFGIIASVVVVVCIKFKQYRDHIVNKSTSQDIHVAQPSAPPLFVMDAPQIFRDYRGADSCVIGIERERKQQAKVFKQPDALYYWEGEVGSDDEPRDAEISGNAENTHSRSHGANRSQPEEGACSGRIFALEGCIGLINNSATDLSTQLPNEICTANDGSIGVDLVPLDVVDASQVDEDSVTLNLLDESQVDEDSVTLNLLDESQVDEDSVTLNLLDTAQDAENYVALNPLDAAQDDKDSVTKT